MQGIRLTTAISSTAPNFSPQEEPCCHGEVFLLCGMADFCISATHLSDCLAPSGTRTDGRRPVRVYASHTESRTRRQRLGRSSMEWL